MINTDNHLDSMKEQNPWNDKLHQYVPTDEYIPFEERSIKNQDINYGDGKYAPLYSRVKSTLGLSKDQVTDLINGIE